MVELIGFFVFIGLTGLAYGWFYNAVWSATLPDDSPPQAKERQAYDPAGTFKITPTA